MLERDKKQSVKMVVGTLHGQSNFTEDTNERVKWFTENRVRESERFGVKTKRVRSRGTEEEERERSLHRAEEENPEAVEFPQVARLNPERLRRQALTDALSDELPH